ncbi:hypothetical protein C923_03290 [Plasmodium falciparum UGT5.1]|uniref:G-patch domain-containing protein n=4 Tax=Plasmodium falciparum TaxID=5833 RepID=A0A0L0CWA5_PLAFA|nr:hypothetical protein PFNF135_03352 [Plasmodium falciparum NF135/5.C10]EWC76006.1 hypothetical protein C923_03290 [Plasmodium falciparum UGT5.1]KNC36501.1 hypothetical protein PFLG_01317 [Plasmodium falciparum RAJ116]KOB88930.1 hypothetical protein PFDG_03918 [Plasmodium falciparum Dd2]
MSKKYYEKLLSDIQNQSKPVESKFGSYILQKFGWEKGKGLGKHENGDVKIIKIKKYGEHGLGYNEHEENNNGMWWENMYNNCAKKINTDNNKNTTNSSTSNNNSKEKIVKNNQNIKYSLFVKKDTCIISSACTSLEQQQQQQQQAEDEKINKTQDVKIKNKHINKNENNIHNIKLITNKSSEKNHDEYVKRNKKKKKKKKKKKHKHKHKSEDKSDDDKTVD